MGSASKHDTRGPQCLTPESLEPLQHGCCKDFTHVKKDGYTMPTYDYYCPENGRVVVAFHAMSVQIETWGELCELASIDTGQTAKESPVHKQIGAGIAMVRRPDQLSGMGGGCCGLDGCGD